VKVGSQRRDRLSDPVGLVARGDEDREWFRPVARTALWRAKGKPDKDARSGHAQHGRD
jgi:hypothetical protein